MPVPDLGGLGVAELWTVWRDALEQLKSRGVLRSTGGPVGDYAEWFVAHALGLTRATYPTPGFDAETPDGTRYSVKARRWGRSDRPTRVNLGNLESAPFDRLVFVLLSDVMEVVRAVELRIDTARPLLLRDGRNTTVGRLLEADGALDVTAKLREVVPG